MPVKGIGELAPAKLEILAFLLRAPAESIRKLAKQTGHSPSTIDNDVLDLASRGLVQRVSTGEIQLTEKGRFELFDEALRILPRVMLNPQPSGYSQGHEERLGTAARGLVKDLTGVEDGNYRELCMTLFSQLRKSLEGTRRSPESNLAILLREGERAIGLWDERGDQKQLLEWLQFFVLVQKMGRSGFPLERVKNPIRKLHPD